MAKIGVFCLPMNSHTNLFVALAEELTERGHRLVFFDLPGNERKIRDAGFEFESVAPQNLPAGYLENMMRDMATVGPLSAMRMQSRFDDLRYEAILQRGPSLIKKWNLDGALVDQADACSGSVMEAAHLPWVSVANGLCLNSEPVIPPFFTSWHYSQSKWAIFRNQVAYSGVRVATLRTQSIINRYRSTWGLKSLNRMDDCFSRFAQICQQNPEFDFPRKRLPANFYYTGPIRSKRSAKVDFPWDRLDGSPLIYASLGTVVNRHKHLYRNIAQSCEGLPVQLVISLGGGAEPENYNDLPGHPLVVKFAPQTELLARAALTITHGGLNTTLESLSHGVPLVAIPITFEQPGVAARVRWSGTGEFVSSSRATTSRLRSCILKVLHQESYRAAARAMAEKIGATCGRRTAADIAERAFSAG